MPLERGQLTLTVSKRIKPLDSWPLKILHVPGGDRQLAPARDRSDVAIFNRHRLACYLQLVLLIRPHVSDRDVESKNPAVHCLDQFREPFLQRHSLLSALGARPNANWAMTIELV